MQQDFLSAAWLNLIAAAALLFFGIRAIVTHDLTFVRSKKAPPVKDEINYAKSAGKLMLLLAVVSLLMGVFTWLWGSFAGLAVFMVGIVIFMALWVQMDKKYGEKR